MRTRWLVVAAVTAVSVWLLNPGLARSSDPEKGSEREDSTEGEHARAGSDFSDGAERQALERLARSVLRVNLSGSSAAGQDNWMGVGSADLVFSRRLDSRTFLVNDKRYGVTGEAGVFVGADEDLLRRARRLIDRLGIPRAEIAKEEVLREINQDASVVDGTVTMGRPRVGKVFARLSRQIEGLPVFSSHALIGLARDGGVGFMEVHWPEVPSDVVKEAHRLAFRLRAGWTPPSLDGAAPESVEAGIVHSAALGFVMDIYPAIRVIYTPTGKVPGKKPELYLNRDGHAVPLPRQFALPCEKPEEGRQSQGETQPPD